MKTFLFILISFIAITATLSGLVLISIPDGSILKLPVSLLKGTPFRDFLIPGLILSVFVGGVNLVAVYFNLQRHRLRYNWAIAGGIMNCGWIIGQIMLINTLYWLHFLYFGIGILVILLAYQLKGKWAV
jgi:hypothetical protein